MSICTDISERLNGLYQENPEKFDEEVKSILEEFFDNIKDPEKREHLRRFQFRIDGELRKFTDPVARMNKMVELFWVGVNEFHATLTNPITKIAEASAPVPNNVYHLKEKKHE